MIRWGINALNHGSSLAIFDENVLLYHQCFGGDELNISTVDLLHPDHIYWYERPWIKKARQLKARQWSRVFDFSVLPKNYLKCIGFGDIPITYTPHHASHAAAGYYTSPFDECVVVVLDAIGEFECGSIWIGQNNQLKKIWSMNYPNSLGLFYSAFTHLIGYQPIKEEYQLQRLSKHGNPNKYIFEVNHLFKQNLHKGVRTWPHEIKESDKADIAAAVQMVFEQQVDSIMTKARQFSDSLVYMGGCAFNSQANQNVVENKFRRIWSLPNPGDASSAIGAVLYQTQQKLCNFNFDEVKHIKISI